MGREKSCCFLLEEKFDWRRRCLVPFVLRGGLFTCKELGGSYLIADVKLVFVLGTFVEKARHSSPWPLTCPAYRDPNRSLMDEQAALIGDIHGIELA